MAFDLTLHFGFLKHGSRVSAGLQSQWLINGLNLGKSVNEQVNRKDTSQLYANRIIDVFLSSETMTDIVLLFRRNPMLIDSGDHIASRIGRKGESVERDLKRLAKLGFLNAEKIGKKTWFGFNAKKDRQIQEIIKNYISSCGESVSARAFSTGKTVTASPQ